MILQNNFLKSKNGNLLSAWWFAVLVIVATGVIIGVILFYSSSLDARSIEAKILADKVAECLFKIKPENAEFMKDFDIFSSCRINKELFLSGTNYYLNISVSSNDKISSVNFGKSVFEEECKISQSANARYFPECYETNIIIYDKLNNALKIKIISASNNDGGVL